MITEKMIEAAATEIRLQLGSIGAFISAITCQRITKDALEAAERAAVSEEPTEAMIWAGIERSDEIDAEMQNYVSGASTDWDTGMKVAEIWKAMLAVRPLPSPPEAPKGEES